MAYTEQTWFDGSDGSTPLSADRLNHIEAGIADALTDVAGDSTPQLGGDLDLNGFAVGTATAADLTKLHAVTKSAAEINGVENAADVTDAGNVGAAIHGATAKTAPVDADELGIIDSAAANVLKLLTFANLKAWIKSWIVKGDVGLGNVTNNAQFYAGGTDVPITDGGTGVSTLPSGLLKGAGTGAITAATAGTDYYNPGGTDVAVADGGTGASTASGARNNLDAQARFMTGTIATAINTTAKTVTLDSPWASVTPATGDLFLLTYTNGNSASSATIAINGTTARNVRTISGQTGYLWHSVEAGGAMLYRFDGTYMRPISFTTGLYEIPASSIINTSDSETLLITGRRAEYLMANEATKVRTLTNKRTTKRVATVASSATPTFATDDYDQCEMLTLTHNVTSATFSGTPTNGQILALVFKSAAPQTIALGSSVIAGPAPLLTATVAGRYHELLLKYNSDAAKWVVMASDAKSSNVEYTGQQTLTAQTIPTGATSVDVTVIPAGSGGASGRRGAAATLRCGGGGGAGAGVTRTFRIPAKDFGSTWSLYLPTAGAGGAAQTTNDTNGNNGALPSGSGFPADGAAAAFTTGSVTIIATYGDFGHGGTNTDGYGGQYAGSGAGGEGGNGGDASAAGGVGGEGSSSYSGGPAGGGAGGGLTAANTAANGGEGGVCAAHGLTNPTGGVVAGAAPGTGTAVPGLAGHGGGGGAASVAGAGQAGATPLGYGAGGGGGGASVNGQPSGAGGAGGPSFARLVWNFG